MSRVQYDIFLVVSTLGITTVFQVDSVQAEALPYYADVHVDANAVRASDPNQVPFAVKADVYINGTMVDRTPYSDGLPAGRYSVEIRYEDAIPYQVTLNVAAGQSYTVDAKLALPLTREERAAQAAFYLAEHRKKEKEAFAQYQKDHDVWLNKYAPLKPKRKRLLITGGVALGCGVATIIPGAVLLVGAERDDNEARLSYDVWSRSTSPDDIQHYAIKTQNLVDSRDKKQVSGIVLMSLGGALMTSGILSLILAPRIPKEPETSARFLLSSVEIAPYFGSQTAGMLLHSEF